MASALDGITVLDLTEGPAGTLTAMFLCDHGASVIRVVDSNDTAPRHEGYLVSEGARSASGWTSRGS